MGGMEPSIVVVVAITRQKTTGSAMSAPAAANFYGHSTDTDFLADTGLESKSP
jgi:hypothetical protein